MKEKVFKKNIALLSDTSVEEGIVAACSGRTLPSVQALRTIVKLVCDIVFPA